LLRLLQRIELFQESARGVHVHPLVAIRPGAPTVLLRLQAKQTLGIQPLRNFSAHQRAAAVLNGRTEFSKHSRHVPLQKPYPGSAWDSKSLSYPPTPTHVVEARPKAEIHSANPFLTYVAAWSDLSVSTFSTVWNRPSVTWAGTRSLGGALRMRRTTSVLHPKSEA